MKKTLQLSFLLLLVSFGSFAQSGGYWKKTDAQKLASTKSLKNRNFPSSSLYYDLNLESLKQTLSVANDLERTASNLIVSIPNIEGKLEQFKVWEYSNFSPELQKQYPNIRAYAGVGITDKTANLRISVSSKGVQTMILRGDRKTEFMEPFTTDGKGYALFHTSEEALPFTCTTHEEAPLVEELNNVANAVFSNAQVLKTFRLALSCTGEYTQYHGGTVADALDAMNATMTRVNGVYEIDLAVKLELIPQQANIIYTNPATDPYSPAGNPNANNGAGDGLGASGAWTLELQNNLTATIGNEAYDIGHIFGASGGGGNAGCIGCICVDPTPAVPRGKGSGFTSPYDGIPEGDKFDIDYVAHELGHQLGGNHTFSHNVENAGVNVEVGGGSTIMAYAGITDYNIQANSDDYFTYRSIQQIQNNLQNKTCGVNTPLANTPPTIGTLSNYIIPVGTPFVLEGTGSDAETNDAVTYTWEQNNSGTTATTGANSYASPTKRVGPIFRSLPPTSSPVRYFPSLETVASGVLSNNSEAIPTIARAMAFTLTARDYGVGGGQTSTASLQITTNANVGPFDVTSQNTSGIYYFPGQSQTVTWAVNNTNTLVGAENVQILLSTDGGLTFPHVVVASTPNDGNEVVTIPNVSGEFCRFMVKPTNNVFFDINSKLFSIGYDCNVVTNATSLAIPDGVGSVSGAFAESVINVPSSGTVENIKISVNVTHPRIGNLRATLLHPDGTSIILFNRSCNAAVYGNMSVVFENGAPSISTCSSPLTGTYRPAGNLANLNGKSVTGNWILRLQDYSEGSVGALDSWSINFGCTLGNDKFSGLADFKLYPNPNKGNFTVQFDSKSSNDINIFVNDISGRQIFKRSYQNSGLFNEKLQLDNIQSGIYLVTVQDGDRKEVKKIVVE